MTHQVNLNDLADLVFQKKPELKELRPVIIKEMLHSEIIFAMDKAGLLNKLVFHGGNALRLCYGAKRFSEDLDFTGGPNFTRNDVNGISNAIESRLTRKYGLETTIREPKPRKNNNKPVQVDTWQIQIITDPGKSHLPRQRIKIDIATMKAETRDLQITQQNYSVLPRGLSVMIPTMSMNEILSNKLVSLPASAYRNNIRHRDIWDISWLNQHGAKLNPHWLKDRVNEFGINDYIERIDALHSSLAEYIHHENFQNTMNRFLPRDVREHTLARPEFLDYLIKNVNNHLTMARKAFIEPMKALQNNDWPEF